MKTSLFRSLILLTLTVAGGAYGQTYQWKDASGRTIISDTPPPASIKAKQPFTPAAKSAPAYGSPDSSTTTAPKPATAPAAAPQTMAEKDLAFRKRQQENQEKEEKAAKEANSKAQQAADCERARRQLAALDSGQRMASINEKGERQIMEDRERTQESERIRRYLNEQCK